MVTAAAAYFEALYQREPDPWRYASSAYERDKYAATLAALGRRRFPCGLEIGCSIGVFTAALAPRCDRLLAVDLAPSALAMARARCRDLPQVTLRRLRVPQQWPPGRFDLIVLSEMLYYLSPADIACTARRAGRGLRRAGRIVLVHWTGPTGARRDGATAARLFLAALPRRRRVRTRRRPGYRLDVLA